MKKIYFIAFAGAVFGQLIATFITQQLYRWSNDAFGVLFGNWFHDRGYNQAVYYFGSFWLTLPHAIFAMFCGVLFGHYLNARTSLLIAACIAGWVLSWAVLRLLYPLWWVEAFPYNIVFLLSLNFSLGLLSLGVLCGNGIRGKRSTSTGNDHN